MLKKSLLSIAIATSVVGVSGCNISSTTDNKGNVPEIQQTAGENQQEVAQQRDGLSPVFNAVTRQLPFGIDLIFAKAPATDGTADACDENVVDDCSVVTSAVNDLDGISTLSPIDITISGSVDPSTVVAGSTVHLVRLPNKADAANLSLPSGITAADIDGLDVASIANYFDDSVVADNLATIIGSQPQPGTNYEASVISLDDGEDNVIRVSPVTPLDSATKYIVLITGGVEDTEGNGLITSGFYEYATTYPSEEAFTAAIAPVHDAVQAWESLASAILTAGGQNLAPLADDIVLTSAFTTTDPDMVLKAMADPGYWAPAVITNNTIADAVITAGNIDASGVADAAKIPTAIQVARQALTSANDNLGGATAYEHPRARAFEIIPNVGGAGVDQLSVNALTQDFETPLTEDVMVSQGAIELPQYTVAFNGADTSTFSDTWVANSTVGAVLDGALGQPSGTTPPSDVDGAKNVTYRFPFAMEKRKAVVPVLMFEPQAGSTGPSNAGCTKPGAGWPVVIIQHGFTSDRTGNLINGAKIADQTCHAVIAMDLPHHGAAPESSGFGLNVDFAHSTSAETPFAAAKEGAIQALGAENTMLDDLAERHQGFYGVSGAPTPVVYAEAEGDRVGDSGTLWIRLDNFQRTRDNLRQAVMDLLNLNASLANIDIDGDGTAADLDTNNVNYVGHSLGAIVGTNFIAVNNSSANTNLHDINATVLATPGGHFTKLVENSVGIGQDIIDGLEALEPTPVVQGTSTFESFMKVLQATIDSGDPMNFISDLAAGGVADIPTHMIGMYGDLLGAAIPSDLVVPISGEGVNIGASSLYLPGGQIVQPETSNNPLTGLKPMLSLIGAENLDDTPAGTKTIAKFNRGGHSTFSSAGTRASGSPFYDSKPAHDEMIYQTVELLNNGAAAVDDSTLLISDAP